NPLAPRLLVLSLHAPDANPHRTYDARAVGHRCHSANLSALYRGAAGINQRFAARPVVIRELGRHRVSRPPAGSTQVQSEAWNISRVHRPNLSGKTRRY